MGTSKVIFDVSRGLSLVANWMGREETKIHLPHPKISQLTFPECAGNIPGLNLARLAGGPDSSAIRARSARGSSEGVKDKDDKILQSSCPSDTDNKYTLSGPPAAPPPGPNFHEDVQKKLARSEHRPRSFEPLANDF